MYMYVPSKSIAATEIEWGWIEWREINKKGHNAIYVDQKRRPIP